jgi:hypothetical protein
VHVGQVTIYIDEETEKKMVASAGAENVSKSKWITDLIREKVAKEWPPSVREIAGSWEDFPSAEELRSEAGKDASREKF